MFICKVSNYIQMTEQNFILHFVNSIYRINLVINNNFIYNDEKLKFYLKMLSILFIIIIASPKAKHK